MHSESVPFLARMLLAVTIRLCVKANICTAALHRYQNAMQKPNTPRATQAPPGATDEAPPGMWRMMPAGVVSSRFQQLFKGKGALLAAHLTFHKAMSHLKSAQMPTAPA